jgi:hypothetical protein
MVNLSNDQLLADGQLCSIAEEIINQKTRKQGIKALGTYLNHKSNEENLQSWFLSISINTDVNTFKKVSVMIESSDTARNIISSEMKSLLQFLQLGLSKLQNQGSGDHNFIEPEFDCCCVKACLQTFQFLKDGIAPIFLGQDQTLGTLLSDVLSSLIHILVAEATSKECSLLTGTALIFALKQAPSFSTQMMEMVTFLDSTNLETTFSEAFLVRELSVINPVKKSSFGILSLINGILSAGKEFLLQITHEYSLLFLTLDILLNRCELEKDSTSKYLAFQVLCSWLSTIKSIELKKIGEMHHGLSVFQENDAYFKKILALVWKHLDDLVDGIPTFVRKIFAQLLFLHQKECKLLGRGCHGDVAFLSNILHQMMRQATPSKGQFGILMETINTIGSEKVLAACPELQQKLVDCMTTCNLPSTANEVYQLLLKSTRKSISGEEEFEKYWVETWMEIIVDCLLQTKDIPLREHVSQYWLPSTFRLMSSNATNIFHAMEKCILSKNYCHESHKQSITNLNHTYGLSVLLKQAILSNVITTFQLNERKQLLHSCLVHIDEDTRIEAFMAICSGVNRAPELLDLQLQFLHANLNYDSQKFRQQLSALKRLLIVDSCQTELRYGC